MTKPTTLQKLSQTSAGKIYETNCFRDGLYFLEKEKNKNKKKLALVDLDNTVLSYRHTLGTDEWFDFDFNEFIKKGSSVQQAKENTLSAYLEIVRKIHPDDIYVVEENTPEAIRTIQSQGIDTLALTSRGSYLLEVTEQQLKRFEIDFNKGSYANIECPLPPSPEGLFHLGMILTGGQHKGECLLTCLENSNKIPEFVTMWDDKLNNLEKVRSSIEQYNAKMQIEANITNRTHIPIQFIGLRYSKLDSISKELNPQVVEANIRNTPILQKQMRI